MPTKIEWCEETWNPCVGCTKCSPGCEHCYAERMAYRLFCMGNKKYENVVNGITTSTQHRSNWSGQIYCDSESLDQPLHWRKPRRIFVCSMSDLFHEKVPFEFIDDVFERVWDCPQHTFLVLTKRLQRAKEFYSIATEYHRIPKGNLWLGVSISTQKEADEKIPILLEIPAAVRFISFEPLLESIPKFDYYINNYTTGHLESQIHWVIVGCESGPKRRPCKLEWIRDIAKQCKNAGVACFVKQIPINGKVNHNPAEWPRDLRIRNYP